MSCEVSGCDTKEKHLHAPSPILLNDQALKDLVKIISDSELLVSELIGGFSFSELSQIVTVANDLPLIKTLVPEVIPQFEQLTDAGREDLVSYIQANCKFPANMTVEVYASKILQAAILMSKIYQLFA